MQPMPPLNLNTTASSKSDATSSGSLVSGVMNMNYGDGGSASGGLGFALNTQSIGLMGALAAAAWFLWRKA